jgi:hypothetical protein
MQPENSLLNSFVMSSIQRKVDYALKHNLMESEMKQNAKPSTATEQAPKATEILGSIVELAIPFRYPNRVPTLADVARTVAGASRVLHIRDLDERIETENAVVPQFAKKRGLVS